MLTVPYVTEGLSEVNVCMHIAYMYLDNWIVYFDIDEIY